MRARGGLALWPVVAASALAVLVTVMAGSALFRLSVPASDSPFAMPLSMASYQAAAERLAANPSPAQLAQARRFNDQALSLSPTLSEAWATRAYIDSLTSNRLGPAGLEALRRSYDVAPYGPAISVWRIQFAFAHWTRLPPDIRRLVILELSVVFPYRSGELSAAAAAIPDPSGRRAMIMALDPDILAILQTRALLSDRKRDQEDTLAGRSPG